MKNRILKRSSLEENISNFLEDKSKIYSNPMKRSVVLNNDRAQQLQDVLFREKKVLKNEGNSQPVESGKNLHDELMGLVEEKMKIQNPFMKAKLQFLINKHRKGTQANINSPASDKQLKSTTSTVDQLNYDKSSQQDRVTLKGMREKEKVRHQQVMKCLSDHINSL